MATFVDQLQAAMRAKNSILCVGLDPQLEFIPPHIIDGNRSHSGNTERSMAHMFLDFNYEIIDAIMPFACCVKPNAAFYERSSYMWQTYEQTIQYARSKGLLVINDGKRFDGGDTADAYAATHIGEVSFFDGETIQSPIRADAVTIGGYIGEDTVNRFIKQMKLHGTGAFVVCKTSFNPNSCIEQLMTPNGLTVWEKLAKYVELWGNEVIGDNGYSNLGVVMGATYPDDAEKMKTILPKALKLVPGYGAQGGGADAAVISCNEDGFGAVVNSSRGIIAAWKKGDFAVQDPKDFAKAAAKAADFARQDLNVAINSKFGKKIYE